MSKMEYYEYLEEQGLETVQVSYEEWCMMKAYEGPKQVDESSKTMCAACDIDLATCDIIFAAEGTLYCSRECGCHDFQYMNNFTVDEATKYFDEVAEEINPTDIGLTKGDETNDDA